MAAGNFTKSANNVFPHDPHGYIRPESPTLPLGVVGIAIAVILGVRAVSVDAAGTFLDAGTRAPPVEVLFTASAHPPCVGSPIWGKEKHKSQHRVYLTTVSSVYPANWRKRPRKLKTSAESDSDDQRIHC